MIKWYIFLISILSLLFIPDQSEAQIYAGPGIGYMFPQGRLKEVNLETPGWNVLVESRSYCRLWYGFRIDYFAPDRQDTVTIGYYNNFFMLSPGLRFNLLGCNDYLWRFMPYIQAMLSISSIGGHDKAGRLGLGGAGGVGLAYGFNLFHRCFMLDLNAVYSAPNAILKDSVRETLEFINISLNMSIRL